MLGGSFEGIFDANLLPWAQLAWGAGGGQRDSAAAASLVQRLDWQEMAFTLPGMQSQPLHVCSRAVCPGLGHVTFSVTHFQGFRCRRASMTGCERLVFACNTTTQAVQHSSVIAA